MKVEEETGVIQAQTREDKNQPKLQEPRNDPLLRPLEEVRPHKTQFGQ